jgi:hypothetical protein
MFAIMVVMALFTTFITTPVVMTLYKPARSAAPAYTRRTLYLHPDSPDHHRSTSSKPRVLACVLGNMPNAHTIIGLAEAARGTRKIRPLRMYILHLLEYTERPSSIMKLQRVQRNGLPFWDKQQQQQLEPLGALESVLQVGGFLLVYLV